MGFCGGRTVASVIIVALAFLCISLTESVLLTVFCGTDVFTSDILSLAETYPEAVFITAGSAVVWIFVIPALLLGYVKLHLAFAEGKDESISLLFDMFSSFRKFIGSAFFFLAFAARCILVFSAAILPGGAFFWFSETYIPEGTRTLEILKISAFFIAFAIIALCIFLAFIFIQRWNLAPYYRVCGNGIHKSFSLSAKAAKGLCTDIISFKISFIGWGILSFLILPFLWSAPYYALSNAIYAKYLMERYERSLAQVPESIAPESTFEEKD